MVADIKSLVKQYHAWLRDRSEVREMGEWVEITTPYIDRHNDSLQIYAKDTGTELLLTDDGYVIDDLLSTGCRLETEKRKRLLQMTLNGFGVQLVEGRRLEVSATRDNFPLKKHCLVQAMLAVNDLFYTAAPVVQNLFYDDVVAWLDMHEVRYSRNVGFKGKSGFDHKFDFLIPKSRTQPERILKAIAKPNRDAATSFAFSWTDISSERDPNTQAIALLNDADRDVPSSVTSALESYGIRSLLWSTREAMLESVVS